MKQSLKFNVISGTALYIISVIIAFLMSPFLLKNLGNSKYGLWEIIISLIGYMGLLDLGMGPALIRYVSTTSTDKLKLGIIISSAFYFFLSIGILSFIVLIVISFVPVIILGTFAHDIETIDRLLIIIAFNLLIQFPGTVFTCILLGLQRHYLINTLKAIIAIGQALLIVILFPVMPNIKLEVLAGVETVGLLFLYSIVILLVLFSSGLPRPSISQFHWETVKEMWWFGLKNSMLMLASRLQKQSIPIIIGQVLGINMVVFFSLPNRLVEYGKGLTIAMGNPLMPYFGSLSQSADAEQIKENWKRVSIAMQMVTLSMPVFLFFLGNDFLRIWIGPEYAAKSKYVLWLLVVGLSAEAFSPIAGRFLVGLAKHGKAAKIWLIISVVFIPIAISFAYFAGLEGLAMASALATIIGSFQVLRFTCKEIGITIGDHFRSTVFPSVPAIIMTSIFLSISTYIWHVNNYYDLIIEVIIAMAIYLSFALIPIRKMLVKHN